jgi:EthD domain
MERPTVFKVIWLLKRKPGITFEQFRDHYEASHAVLGQTHFGHLLLAYRRNYNVPAAPLGPEASPVERAIAAKRSDYDCVTEWELRDEQALAEVFELLFDPHIGKLFHDDEEHFLDRNSVRLVMCDSLEMTAANGKLDGQA